MTDRLTVLIIGGGVAGPAAALALLKTGRPCEITIVDAHAESYDIGTYFTLQDNGVDVLRTLEVLPLVQQAGFATTSSRMYNDQGTLLAEIPFGESVTVRRSRVNQLLMEEARRQGCKTIFNYKLVGAEDDGTKVTARFEDGSSLTCDVLIGADGINSRTRQLIDAQAPTSRYVGLVNHAGEVAKPPGLDVAADMWHFFFGRKAFFLYHLTPAGTIVWGINEPRPAVAREERASANTEQLREHLKGLFDEDHGPMQAIIDATPSFDLALDNTCDMTHVPVWCKGRIVLVGDAVHAPAPTSGQGGSMALEDAVILARAIRDQPTIELALQAYEAHRRPRVEAIVAYGARMSSTKMPGRIGRAIRDCLMPLFFKYGPVERQMGWITKYRIAWDAVLEKPVGTSSSTWPWAIAAVALIVAAVVKVQNARFFAG